MKDLTRAEEEVMQILWQINRGFVKDILDRMPSPRPAYNTVSTIIRILETKGFVSHKAYGKTHEYYPLVSKDNYSRFQLNSMLSGYFDGSFQNLVSFFAEKESLKTAEIDELLRQLQNLKKKKS
ncbi:MAG: BlaI/MecI/CopY family transcriptional regulator [Cyclobacteriaceae bacterium]|nr:BlaI/MecI/CopY family transcriptional regulator [Cyclobacteriaceae bacterium]